MKKIFLTALAVLTLVACQEKEALPQYTIIKGQFTNTKGGLLALRNLSGFEKTINIKDTGTLIDTLYVDEGVYNAVFGKQALPMYLTKGSIIEFKADAKEIANTLVYAGDNMDVNNYLAYKAKQNNDIMVNMKTYFTKDETSFSQFLDSAKANLLTAFNKVTAFPEANKQKELRDIEYFEQDQLNKYVAYHPYFSKQENFEVSSAFKARQKALDMNQLDDYLYSSTYNQMVFVNILRNASQLADQDSIPRSEAELLLASEIANDTMSEMLMANFAEMSLSLMKDGKKEYYDKYLSMTQLPKYQQRVKDLYISLQKLEPGNPSPKFSDYENYAGGTTSLDDFKGKYVYIDVWATWCGPCKAEIPYLQEIEEQYHGKNIAFVSISVDAEKDHQKWKDMIAEKNMGGVQLFADAAFNSQFIKDYEIRGIPQFILLDPEGNIVKSQAPRPSEKEMLVNLFNELNI